MSTNDTELAPITALADSMAGATDIDRLAIVLMRAWGEADPRSGVAQHPASYVATFVDLARAVTDASWRAGVPVMPGD